jgi:hypothetical protein
LSGSMSSFQRFECFGLDLKIKMRQSPPKASRSCRVVCCAGAAARACAHVMSNSAIDSFRTTRAQTPSCAGICQHDVNIETAASFRNHMSEPLPAL